MCPDIIPSFIEPLHRRMVPFIEAVFQFYKHHYPDAEIGDLVQL